MADYSKGKIYKIYKKDEPELCYIGSTTQDLDKRYIRHKSVGKIYKSLFYTTVNNQWSNWCIELIILYPCNNKKELVENETKYRLEIGTLNTKVEGRTTTQYRKDKKENIKETNKEYYENNKDILNKKNRIYYQNNKDILLEKQKEYAKNNVEHKSDYDKNYYENNKEKILERKRLYRLKKKQEKSPTEECLIFF